MDDKIYSLAKSLNEELNNDPRVKKLNELEKALNDSYDVYTLSRIKDDALEEYSRLKDIYPEDSRGSDSCPFFVRAVMGPIANRRATSAVRTTGSF